MSQSLRGDDDWSRCKGNFVARMLSLDAPVHICNIAQHVMAVLQSISGDSSYYEEQRRVRHCGPASHNRGFGNLGQLCDNAISRKQDSCSDRGPSALNRPPSVLSYPLPASYDYALRQAHRQPFDIFTARLDHRTRPYCPLVRRFRCGFPHRMRFTLQENREERGSGLASRVVSERVCDVSLFPSLGSWLL